MITVKKVLAGTEYTVSLAEVKESKVYFFKDKYDWFYVTGDMRHFRNLSQTNGWCGGAKSLKTTVRQCMTATNPPREMYEAADMYEFIDYIRQQDQPESL